MRFTTIIACVLFLAPVVSHAQIPPYISCQSVLTDSER
jgi:hypothetical protein